MPAVAHSIPRSVALIEAAVAVRAGGTDGVVRDGDGAGLVSAQEPAALLVDVGACLVWSDRRLFSVLAATLGPVAAPTGGSAGDTRRIDLVQWTRGTGLNIKTGTEAASPEAPALDADSLLLAEIVCRTGMTEIEDTDGGGNDGYLVDKRGFV